MRGRKERWGEGRLWEEVRENEETVEYEGMKEKEEEKVEYEGK